MSYRDKFSLIIEQFCILIEYFIIEAEGLCNNLIFDLKLAINLGIVKDKMANS